VQLLRWPWEPASPGTCLGRVFASSLGLRLKKHDRVSLFRRMYAEKSPNTMSQTRFFS
jgi:hypothetical protein